ncbi:MAG: iron ABC transporter permease [Treponema sp.]|nr:iron ABC transporter permease [Treponema sp.]
MPARIRILLASAISLLILLTATSLGSTRISLADTMSILFCNIFRLPLPAHVETAHDSVVWLLRFPRALLAFLVGGSLAVSGAVCQSVLRNPLATPHILGVSAGASVGAGLIIISGISLPVLAGFTLPVVGFSFALVTVFVVVIFSSRVDRSMSDNTIILCGMVISLFLNALLATLGAVFSEDLRRIILWQMGSFAMRGWVYVKLFLPFMLVGIIGIAFFTREMDILTFGDEQAKSLGVETGRLRKKLLVFSAILTGTAVALSGVIGFVDLIAPHVARRITGSKHKSLIPMSFILGGSLMVVTDLVARTVIPPSELPVGALTALIGSPFFAWVYFGRRKSFRGQ